MINQLLKSKKREKSSSDLEDKIFYRNLNFYKGATEALIIAVSPFCFYLYLMAPDTKTWDTWFGTITVYNHWPNVFSYIYQIVTKLYIILIWTLFYFSKRSIWKFAILIPITVHLYQLSAIFNDNYQTVDEFEWYHSYPITVPLFMLLLTIGIITYRKKKNLNVDNDMSFEVEDTIHNEYNEYLKED